MSQPVTAPTGRGLVDQLKSILGLSPKEKMPRKIAIEYAPLVVRGSPNVLWLFGSSGAGGTTLMQDLAGYFADRGRRVVLLDFGDTSRREWSSFFTIDDHGWQRDTFKGLGDGNLALALGSLLRADNMVVREAQKVADALMEEDLSNTLILIDQLHHSILEGFGPLLEKIRRTDGAKVLLNSHCGARPELMSFNEDGRIWMRSFVYAEDRTTGIAAAWEQESDLFKIYVAKSRIDPQHLQAGEALVSLKNMAHRVTFPRRSRSYP